MDSTPLDDRLRVFLERLRAEVHPDLVLLFGSRARGDYRPNSDYDLIIVSVKFQGIRWRDRVAQLVKLWASNEMVDLVPYTRAELDSKRENYVSVRAAIDESVQLYPRRPL